MFDDEAPIRPSAALPAEDLYGEDALKRLREENDVKIVLVPLSKSDQKALDEDDALMRYMDATEVVAPTQAPETIVIGDDDAEEVGEDDAFRSKQVEAARILRARLQRGDRTIDGETTTDILDNQPNRKESAMDEDEPYDGQGENVSDDEAEERDALGIDYNGRHYFEDAVTKKKLTGIDALPSSNGASKSNDPDAFFNQPNEADYEWELELIRRSGVKRAHQSMGNAHLTAKTKSDAKTLVEIQTIPERSMEPLSEDEIMKRIERDMAQLESVASLHENRLATIEASREGHTNFLASSDTSYKKATEDLQYFEDFKLYMVDLMDCIESKLPLIEEVEEKMFQTRQIRVRKSQTRIRSAFPEELESVRSGLDSNETSAWKMWRRTRSKRETKKSEPFSYNDPQLDVEEGFSSDEETTSDMQAAYDNALLEVRDAAIAVFDDALPEFCDLRIILEKIASFRSSYPVSYVQASLSSQLAKLLGPIVRLELVSWDPLKPSNVFEWPWFDCFDKFVNAPDPSNQSADEVAAKQASDSQVLADICTEVLLPKVKDAIKYFWRPNSMRDTETLQTLLGNLRHVLPPKPLSEILVAVNMGLKYSITAFSLPTFQTTYQSKSDYPRITFARCLKLMAVVIAWIPYFSPEATRSMLIDSIVNEKIVPYLQSYKSVGTMERWRQARLVVASLSTYLTSLRPEFLSTAISSLNPFNLLLQSLEKDSFGNYETFEISESVTSQWKTLHG